MKLIQTNSPEPNQVSVRTIEYGQPFVPAVTLSDVTRLLKDKDVYIRAKDVAGGLKTSGDRAIACRLKDGYLATFSLSQIVTCIDATVTYAVETAYEDDDD